MLPGLSRCSVCGKACKDVEKHARWAHPDRRPAPASSPARCLAPDAALVASERAHIQREQLQMEVATDLLDLRFERGLREPDLQAVKACTTRWVDGITANAHAKLDGLIKPGVTAEQVKEALGVNLFEGLETTKKEVGAAKNTLN
jgi:hypothetical protein